MLLFTDGFDVWVSWFYVFSNPFECTAIPKEGFSCPLLFLLWELIIFLCWIFLFLSFTFASGTIQTSFHLSHLSAFCALSLPFQPWQFFFFSPVVSLNSLLSSFQELFLQPPNPSQPPLPWRNCLFWSPWQQESCVNLFLWFASACILRVHRNQPASCLWQSFCSLQRWENQGCEQTLTAPPVWMWWIRSGISSSEHHRPGPVSSSLPSPCSLLVGEWTVLDVNIELLAWGARGLHCRVPHLEHGIKPACRVTQLKNDWKHFLQLPADSLRMSRVLTSLLLQRWRQSFISMCFLQSVSLLPNINSTHSITCSVNGCIKCNHQELASLLYQAPWVGETYSELWLKESVMLAALKVGKGGLLAQKGKARGAFSQWEQGDSQEGGSRPGCAWWGYKKWPRDGGWGTSGRGLQGFLGGWGEW